MQITDSTNDQLMCIAAHRYCLGRASYIVGSCVEWLMAHWGQLTENTRAVIVRDTKEALAAGRAGMDMDVREWGRFLEFAGKQEKAK